MLISYTGVVQFYVLWNRMEKAFLKNSRSSFYLFSLQPHWLHKFYCVYPPEACMQLGFKTIINETTVLPRKLLHLFLFVLLSLILQPYMFSLTSEIERLRQSVIYIYIPNQTFRYLYFFMQTHY